MKNDEFFPFKKDEIEIINYKYENQRIITLKNKNTD